MSDWIDRQKAIDALETVKTVKAENGELYIAKINAQMKLEILPSIQPERLKGGWTKNNACQFCGFQPWYERDIHTLSFCPNCGADMRGEKDG